MSNKIKAFVGHSFSPEDEEIVRKFTDFLNTIKESTIDFSWDHAKPAQAKELFDKVREKMKDKNLFIGICTKKELVINEKSLKKSFFGIFGNDSLSSKVDDYKSKTSDWLLQEIGYALGKEMDIILLVEEGIRNPGEFQGNLERINFSRDYPGKAFDQIMQMIISLTPKEETEFREQAQSEIETKEMPFEERLDEYYEIPKEEWLESDYERAMEHFIWRNDAEKEEIIDQSFLNKYGEEKRIGWDGLKLYYKEIYQKENNLERLKSIEESHPENPVIKLCLAKLYDKYKDLPKSADYFEKASNLFEDELKRLINYCESAKTNAIDGKSIQSLLLFEKAKPFIKGIEDREILFLNYLQNVADSTKNFNEYLAYGERILNLKPDDHMTRFRLAYKYSESGQDEMALFHYKILTDRDPGEAYWNNLGISQLRLGLKGKAVDSYLISQENGGTWAMNNLAELYIAKGFYIEAKEICKEAMKIEGHEKVIGETDLKIDNIIKEESESEGKIIEKTITKRMFGIKFGLACTEITPSQLSKSWIGNQCPLEITIEGNAFVAEGEYEKESSSPFGGGFGLGAALTDKIIIEKIKVKYSGMILGRGIRFTKTVSQGRASLLLGSSDVEGLMIISEGLNEIQVYEKNKAESANIYFIKKLETPE